MNHNQRPGRIRMIGGTTAPSAPVRDRRARTAPAEAGGVDEAVGPSSFSWRLTLLFLLGCAAGGAALPLLGWFQ